MLSSSLNEPVLSANIDAVARLSGSDDALGSLWSVFTKVKHSVADGPRLENMAWRLWHRARAAPNLHSPLGLPHHPPMAQHPLASPSLSISSSSEGMTTTSSDWDHDTAVGDEDFPQSAYRNTAVSPLSEKFHLNPVSGCPSQTRASHLPSPAPSSRRQSSADEAAHPRVSPSAQSDSTPHPPHSADAVTDATRERVKGALYSDSLHHPFNSALPIPGLKIESSPHDGPLPRIRGSPVLSNPSSNAAPTHTVASESRPLPSTSSSMPLTLPSMSSHRKPFSVAHVVAELFPDKAHMKSSDRQLVAAPTVRQGTSRSTLREEQLPLTPTIVQPSPTTAPHLEAPASPRFGVHSPTSYSVTASATSTPRQVFPTVVVVNPTPHPTPPATPSPSSENRLQPFDQQTCDPWVKSEDDQLRSPISMNGEARSISPAEPKFVMVESKNQAHLPSSPRPQTSLLPATAITLPERPTDIPSSSHLPTPSSESSFQTSEMLSSSKLTSVPVVQPPPSMDKKFFLAAPYSAGSGGSGPESSESPESLGGGSVSPAKAPRGSILGMVAPQSQLGREDEITSSFSASPPGRAPSIASSKGSKLKQVSVASGNRRKPTAKKLTLPAKQSPTKGSEVQPRSKGKEKDVGERTEVSASGSSAVQAATVVKPQPPPAQPRVQIQQPPSLRQLPTNPPRQPTRPDPEAPRLHPTPPATTRQLPFHPQLGHLGLGHLPTVPSRQRRPIEITETSSEYETTDSEGDESSWESESGSGDEVGSTRASVPAAPGEPTERSDRQAQTTVTTSHNRTRDAGEFARDAALEAQRRRGLFQKLPARSYSHLSQLPRTKSGLSLLFRPDPELFPEGHPYRTTRNSHDILARNWSAPAPPLAIAAVSKRSAAAGPMQAAVNADPVVASVSSKSGAAGGSGTHRPNGVPRGYRPRGKPEGQEEETDSDDDDPEDAIQVSSSVAQRKLAALMGQRHDQQRQPAAKPTPNHVDQVQPPPPQQSSKPTSIPVLMHPYLPDPAPLQTPHTVRRNIISQELDEELRRNLLWERSQNQIQGRPARAPGSILPGPWRPLTAVKAEDNRETQSSGSGRGPGQRPFATQRTKSWAGDFHASGW